MGSWRHVTPKILLIRLGAFFQIPVMGVHRTLGAHFSKSFLARKTTTKILNLKFTEPFFSHNFNKNKVNFHAKFMPIHCFLFEIQIIKNGFMGPISYRVFRETGPWTLKS